MTQKNELRKWPSVGRTQKITLADCLGRSFINIYGGFLSHDGVPHDLSSIDGISHDINFHFGIPPFMETRIYIYMYIYIYVYIYIFLLGDYPHWVLRATLGYAGFLSTADLIPLLWLRYRVAHMKHQRLMSQWEFSGILKWRYVRTMFGQILWGIWTKNIPLHSPYRPRGHGTGSSSQFISSKPDTI